MSEAASGAIDRVDHLTIVVRDVDAAAARYEALLGTAPNWRGDHPDNGTRAVLFGLGNTVVELVGPAAQDERDEGLRNLLDARGEGLYTLAFGTDDADACRARLRERQLRAAPPVDGESHGSDGETRSYRAVELSPRQTRGLSVLVVQRDDVATLQRRRSDDHAAVVALDHVVVRTADPDAGVAFHGDGLGLRLALDREFRGTRMLFFRVGGVTVEVVGAADADAERDAFYGLAYRVGDLDAAHARLGDAGFAVSDPRDGNKPGTRVFTVRDGTCGVPTLVIRDPSRDARDGL